MLTDAGGKTIKTFSLNASGVFDLNTSALSSGTYHYSLPVNGAVAAAKKPVVVR